MPFTADDLMFHLMCEIQDEFDVDIDDFEKVNLTVNYVNFLVAKTIESLVTWNCMDCDDNCFHNGEYYMVKDEVWDSAVPDKNGMLCIGCLESRIGRRLVASDFTDAPINAERLLDGSERIKDRLNS